MTRSIGIVVVLILVGIPALADEGGVTFPIEWAPGHIYVEEESSSVRLNREILELQAHGTGHVWALFEFINDSSRSQTVLSGFPVELKIPFYTTDHDYRIGAWNVSVDPDVVRLLTDDTGSPLFVKDDEEPSYFAGSIEGLENGFRVIEADEFFEQPLSDDGLGLLQSIQIIQDDADVSIDRIIIESLIDHHPEGGGGSIRLTLHFIHTLVFPAGRSSIVEISYDTPSVRRIDRMRTSFEVNYILGTGATWKGPIGRLLIISPDDVELRDDTPGRGGSHLTTTFTGSANFITVADYEPGSDATVRVHAERLHDFWAKPVTPRKEDARPAPDSPCGIVANVAASSFYGGTTSVLERTSYVLTTYGPVASFDCVGANAWVEGMPGDGIGEWIEFDLTRPAYGPVLTNGLTMINDAGWEWGETEVNLTDAERRRLQSIWGRNNRVRELALRRIEEDGSATDLGSIQLADTRYDAGDRQFLLRSGRYRLTIESVYSGTDWDDTCLGEIEFREVSNVLMDWYESDPFFAPTIARVLE